MLKPQEVRAVRFATDEIHRCHPNPLRTRAFQLGESNSVEQVRAAHSYRSLSNCYIICLLSATEFYPYV